MAPAIPDDIGKSTGPQLFGFLFNYFFMGALFVQVYHYYVSFPRDRMLVKTIVYGLTVLELLQTALMGYSAYSIFGAGYGNLDAFNEIQVDWLSVCVLGAIIPGIVQGFYAHRLFLFSESKVGMFIICLLALTQTVAGLVQGVFSKMTAVNDKLTARPDVVIIWMVSAALCDILIASSMTYYLKRRQNDAFSDRTKDAVTRIVRYTIETGAITAVASIVLLVLFLGYPTQDYYAVPNRALAKLYSNNLLVLLNSRAIVLGGRTDASTHDATSGAVDAIRFKTTGSLVTGIDPSESSYSSQERSQMSRQDRDIWSKPEADIVRPRNSLRGSQGETI